MTKNFFCDRPPLSIFLPKIFKVIFFPNFPGCVSCGFKPHLSRKSTGVLTFYIDISGLAKSKHVRHKSRWGVGIICNFRNTPPISISQNKFRFLMKFCNIFENTFPSRMYDRNCKLKFFLRSEKTTKISNPVSERCEMFMRLCRVEMVGSRF